MLRIWRFALPLIIFIGLLWFLYKGLSLKPSELPSALIDRPAPEFSLPQLQTPELMLTKADMQGKVWLLNVWGSWCAACQVEHPVWMKASKRENITMVGLNWKDDREAALQWLNKLGNPYLVTMADLEGKVAIDLGVVGAPETFLIDKQGMIRYKHTGPVTEQDIYNTLLPLIRKWELAP